MWGVRKPNIYNITTVPAVSLIWQLTTPALTVDNPVDNPGTVDNPADNPGESLIWELYYVPSRALIMHVRAPALMP